MAVPETLKAIVEIFLSNLNRMKTSSSSYYREEIIKAILHACLGREEERKKEEEEEEEEDEFAFSRIKNYSWFFAVLLDLCLLMEEEEKLNDLLAKYVIR